MSAITKSEITNICGLVVHVASGHVNHVADAIASMPGCDVHLREEATGRLVVTAMDDGDARALDRLTDIHRLSGVVSAALAYHHLEDLSEVDLHECACGSGSQCSSHAETHDVR